MFDSGVILLGKIRYLSLLGIKGLNAVFFKKKKNERIKKQNSRNKLEWNALKRLSLGKWLLMDVFFSPYWLHVIRAFPGIK